MKNFRLPQNPFTILHCEQADGRRYTNIKYEITGSERSIQCVGYHLNKWKIT